MVSFVKEFESYVLSDFNQDSLLSVIPGSQSDIYLQLLNQIKKLGEKKEVTEEVRIYQNKIKNNSILISIKFLNTFSS